MIAMIWETLRRHHELVRVEAVERNDHPIDEAQRNADERNDGEEGHPGLLAGAALSLEREAILRLSDSI
jgi:hypothetical protein